MPKKFTVTRQTTVKINVSDGVEFHLYVPTGQDKVLLSTRTSEVMKIDLDNIDVLEAIAREARALLAPFPSEEVWAAITVTTKTIAEKNAEEWNARWARLHAAVSNLRGVLCEQAEAFRSTLLLPGERSLAGPYSSQSIAVRARYEAEVRAASDAVFVPGIDRTALQLLELFASEYARCAEHNEVVDQHKALMRRLDQILELTKPL